MVLRGTTVSGDNYWKGETGHRNAAAMAEVYGCPDPYMICEMEDAALAVALDRQGLLDRFLILRASVNLDVFMNGMTPEALWAADLGHGIAAEESVESADIFATAMENEFRVGRILIDAMLRGEIKTIR
jgi:purine nucleoside permease